LSVRMTVIIVASQPSFLFDLSHSDVANLGALFRGTLKYFSNGVTYL
jgi:hypothetical protein